MVGPSSGNAFSVGATALAAEYGIGVRAGHLCQYEVMRKELGIPADEQARLVDLVRQGDKSQMYGMVRASCGLSTAVEDVHRLAGALREFVEAGPRFEYVQNSATGQFDCKQLHISWANLVPPSLRFLACDSS